MSSLPFDPLTSFSTLNLKFKLWILFLILLIFNIHFDESNLISNTIEVDKYDTSFDGEANSSQINTIMDHLDESNLPSNTVEDDKYDTSFDGDYDYYGDSFLF